MKSLAILICIIVLVCVISCVGCGNAPTIGKPTDDNSAIAYPEFTDETEVIINGYDADAMEPFITKDGNFLFFNSLNDGVHTSLYYAVKVNDTHFAFRGEISGVNGTGPHLDAVASLDVHHNFYFVSTRNYPRVFENYQTGVFTQGAVTNAQSVPGNFYIRSPGWIIMDAEISKDGGLLYYVNAHFTGTALPDQSRLGIAEKNASVFKKISLSDSILSKVNDPRYLVYAPAISSDGKELYFTRIEKGTLTTEICVSVRLQNNAAFSAPKKIEISGSNAEAPTLTDDGRRLYYHKKLGIDGKYHIFTKGRI
jgi:hypothetical protein